MKEEIKKAKIEELRRLYGDTNRSSHSIYNRIQELENMEITETKDWKNNIEIVHELYKRIQDAFEKKDIDNLLMFQEEFTGIEKKLANKIEELKDEFKRNNAVKLSNVCPEFDNLLNEINELNKNSLLQLEVFNRFIK